MAKKIVTSFAADFPLIAMGKLFFDLCNCTLCNSYEKTTVA
jgi:hypothetical protein